MITKKDLDRHQPIKDMEPFLGLIYRITREEEPEVVVELGVRTGDSTRAFLAALNDLGKGELISVDNNPCQGVRSKLRGEPRWVFVQSDSVELGRKWKKGIDIILLDTIHTYEQVSSELNVWYPWVRNLIFVHDTVLPRHDYGVKRAVRDFLDDHPEIDYKNLTEFPGLGIMRKRRTT